MLCVASLVQGELGRYTHGSRTSALPVELCAPRALPWPQHAACTRHGYPCTLWLSKCCGWQALMRPDFGVELWSVRGCWCDHLAFSVHMTRHLKDVPPTVCVRKIPLLLLGCHDDGWCHDGLGTAAAITAHEAPAFHVPLTIAHHMRSQPDPDPDPDAGTHAELLAEQGLYARLWARQVRCDVGWVGWSRCCLHPCNDWQRCVCALLAQRCVPCTETEQPRPSRSAPGCVSVAGRWRVCVGQTGNEQQPALHVPNPCNCAASALPSSTAVSQLDACQPPLTYARSHGTPCLSDCRSGGIQVSLP
jgi:hypothetical protein